MEKEKYTIRKAAEGDIPAIAEIYSRIHTEEESGRVTIGWIRSIYPTIRVAQVGVEMDDMYVMETEGRVVASARINREQVDAYADAKWQWNAPEDQVMVLHTLTVDPREAGRGCGRQFVKFYEDMALAEGCPYLRIDTNAINANARVLYSKLGYREADIVPCDFNGIQKIMLVCLEKYLGAEG